MEKENPFTLMYGKPPLSFVSRDEEIQGILSAFELENPQILAYLITGMRGTGKTILMREVAKLLAQKGWIVIDLNPKSDLIHGFAESLFEQGKKLKLYLDWSLTLSASFMSLTIKKETPTSSPDLIANRLVESADRKGKRILVTIDEATATESMRYFANFYQGVIGKGIPLCLLMTGLRENLDALVADKSMSFLSRTPKIELGALNLRGVAMGYAKEFHISLAEAAKMAAYTKGYAFAYQVLGYLCYERGETKVTEEILNAYDSYLWENGYGTLWQSLTRIEKDFCRALADSKTGESKDVREALNMGESNFQNYRGRLLRKGYIVSESYGKISFALPRFSEFIHYYELIGM